MPFAKPILPCRQAGISALDSPKASRSKSLIVSEELGVTSANADQMGAQHLSHPFG